MVWAVDTLGGLIRYRELHASYNPTRPRKLYSSTKSEVWELGRVWHWDFFAGWVVPPPTPVVMARPFPPSTAPKPWERPIRSMFG